MLHQHVVIRRMAIPPQTKGDFRGKSEKDITLRKEQVLTTKLWLKVHCKFLRILNVQCLTPI